MLSWLSPNCMNWEMLFYPQWIGWKEMTVESPVRKVTGFPDLASCCLDQDDQQWRTRFIPVGMEPLELGYPLQHWLNSRSRRLCFVSVRFLSSVNISKSYISDMTWPMLTRLGHKYRLTIPFMSYDQIGVKGHVGVTGVKKVIFTKKVSSPTGYVAWSCDLCIW